MVDSLDAGSGLEPNVEGCEIGTVVVSMASFREGREAKATSAPTSLWLNGFGVALFLLVTMLIISAVIAFAVTLYILIQFRRVSTLAAQTGCKLYRRMMSGRVVIRLRTWMT